MRSSFPLVSDLSPIPIISSILYKSNNQLPLKNVATNLIKNKNDGFLGQLFKSLKINPDILSLMTDLNIIKDSKINDTSNKYEFPGVNLNLADYCGDMRRIKVQSLTNLGVELAQAYERKDNSYIKCLMFYCFLSSKNLPTFFNEIIQNKLFIDKEVQINSLMELTQMKGPDARNFVEWSKWLEINNSYDNTLILDRYVIITKIINSLIYSLNSKMKNEKLFGKQIYFYEIRREISQNLGLNEIYLSFDILFRLIFDLNNEKIFFAPARDGLLGGNGFEGKSKQSIIWISHELNYINKNECKKYSDNNAILVG